MSDQSFIKTPRQLLWVVGLAFIVPISLIFLLVTFVVSGSTGGAGSDAMSEAAVLDRIAPVGAFKFAAASADPNKPARTGEELYKSVCMACHDTGTAGAPKKGDTAAWAPRIAQGYDTLLKNALNGKNAMPAKGGATDASDYEIGRAIVYLTGASGGKFKEPAAPAK